MSSKSSKSFFSKSDLYYFADRIVEMHFKFELLLKFAKAENKKDMVDAYSTLVAELGLLIDTYNLKEMVKINI